MIQPKRQRPCVHAFFHPFYFATCQRRLAEASCQHADNQSQNQYLFHVPYSVLTLAPLCPNGHILLAGPGLEPGQRAYNIGNSSQGIFLNEGT